MSDLDQGFSQWALCRICSCFPWNTVTQAPCSSTTWHTVTHELASLSLEGSRTGPWGSGLEGASSDVALVFGGERCHGKVLQTQPWLWLPWALTVHRQWVAESPRHRELWVPFWNPGTWAHSFAGDQHFCLLNHIILSLGVCFQDAQ